MSAQLQRAGARHVLERRARRRRRRLASAAGMVVVVLGATAAVWASSAADHELSDEWTDVAGAAVTRGDTGGTTTTTTATTTIPTATASDLLAPPPTVIPSYDTSDGRAPLVHRVDTTDPVIFITIDDGHVRDPAYLDHFERLGVPFTSFITEPYAAADPDYWMATMERGGSLQSHTISHPDLSRASEDTIRREVCEPAETFTERFGVRPTLFRPPYGNSNDVVRRIAAGCGYRAVVHWTGSTNIGELTMQDVDLTAGDIILMHYRDTLIADLDDVVARARAEGFTIGRLEDYLTPL